MKERNDVEAVEQRPFGEIGSIRGIGGGGLGQPERGSHPRERLRRIVRSDARFDQADIGQRGGAGDRDIESGVPRIQSDARGDGLPGRIVDAK